ncbi:MAG TPA: aspartyl protease family protein [Gemmatimonadaceae bacterium]
MTTFELRSLGRTLAAALVCWSTLSLTAPAQSSVRVIHATSKVVDIIDGEHHKRGGWYLFPGRKPDIYYVSIPRKPHRVIFRTDRDSIVLDSRYDDVHDFVILLNGVDSCRTRVIAKEKDVLRYASVRRSAHQTSDTIPFTLGPNNRIYLSGQINGSAPLNFQFDLGAGGSILRKGSVRKVAMTFDGTIFLHNSDGRNEVPTSSGNTLTIGPLTWKGNTTFAVADNLDRSEDGLMGNSLLIDKVVEIDYDRRLMIVHDTLPPIPTGYHKRSIILDGVVPFVQADIVLAGDTLTNWYMFDTGYSGLLRLNAAASKPYKLGERARRAFNPFKATYTLPEFRIGGFAIANLKGAVHEIRSDSLMGGLLGNELLKQFNVILDNQNGDIYLRPNGLMVSRGR